MTVPVPACQLTPVCSPPDPGRPCSTTRSVPTTERPGTPTTTPEPPATTTTTEVAPITTEPQPTTTTTETPPTTQPEPVSTISAADEGAAAPPADPVRSGDRPGGQGKIGRATLAPRLRDLRGCNPLSVQELVGRTKLLRRKPRACGRSTGGVRLGAGVGRATPGPSGHAISWLPAAWSLFTGGRAAPPGAAS